MIKKLDGFFLKDKYVLTLLLLAGFAQDQVLVYCNVPHMHQIPLLFAIVVMAYRALRDPEFLSFRGAGIWGLFVIAFIISFAANGFPSVRGNIIDLIIITMTGFLVFGGGSSDGADGNTEDLWFISGAAFLFLGLNSVISLITYVFGVSIQFFEPQGGYPSYIGVSYGFQDRFTCLQGVPNALGWTSVCAIVWGILWLSTGKPKKTLTKVISAAAIAASAVSIGLSFSRGSLLAVTAGFICYFGYRIISRRDGKGIIRIIVEILAVVIIIGGLAYGSTNVSARINGRTTARWYASHEQKMDDQRSGDQKEETAQKPSQAVEQANSGNRVVNQFQSGDVSNGRGIINEIGFKLLRYNHQLAYGVSSGDGRPAWKAFVTDHENLISDKKYEFTRKDDKISGNMHNLFTQVIYNSGLIGLIPLILLVLMFIHSAVSDLKNPERDEISRMRSALFMAICAVGTIAMFENILIYSTKVYNITFMYLLGYFIGMNEREEGSSLIDRTDRRLGGWLRFIGKTICLNKVKDK